MAANCIMTMPSSYEPSLNPESRLTAQPAIAVFINGRRKFLDFLRARVRDPDVAEDILQRASVKILERGADLRQSASAEAWIYRLLRNELVDYYRRATLHSKRTVDLPPDLDLPAPTSASEDRLCPCATVEMKASNLTTRTPCVPWRWKARQSQATRRAWEFP
jgi:DNA-directed RNA polymerase specialized sigma24 family protein